VVARDAGVREKSELYTNRYKVKLIHGLRKYTETTLLDLTDDKYEPILDRGICLELLGNHMELRQRYHTQENYDRRTKEKKELRLLNAYRKAVSELTINDEERERLKREEAEKKLKTMETLELELEQVKQEKTRQVDDLTLQIIESNKRLSKVEKLVGKRLVKTRHMISDIPPDVKNADDWIEKTRSDETNPIFSEPQEELRSPPLYNELLSSEEESLAEEYSNLEHELKEAERKNDKKRVNEIESRMTEIAYHIETIEVD
jgi:hypothetical protein